MLSQAIATNQVSVGTGATQIVPPRPDRRSVTLVLKGAAPVETFIGGPGVTVNNGYPMPAVAGASLKIDSAGAIYGIVASGTQVVGYIEHFG